MAREPTTDLQARLLTAGETEHSLRQAARGSAWALFFALPASLVLSAGAGAQTLDLFLLMVIVGFAAFAGLLLLTIRQHRRRRQLEALVRELPGVLVGDLLRPLQTHRCAEVREIVQPLILELCPPAAEVVPASAPTSRGNEPMPAG